MSAEVKQNPVAKFGLSNLEALARMKKYGRNALPEKPPKSLFSRLVLQFKSPLIYILLVALVVDLFIWFL